MRCCPTHESLNKVNWLIKFVQLNFLLTTSPLLSFLPFHWFSNCLLNLSIWISSSTSNATFFKGQLLLIFLNHIWLVLWAASSFSFLTNSNIHLVSKSNNSRTALSFASALYVPFSNRVTQGHQPQVIPTACPVTPWLSCQDRQLFVA